MLVWFSVPFYNKQSHQVLPAGCSATACWPPCTHSISVCNTHRDTCLVMETDPVRLVSVGVPCNQSTKMRALKCAHRATTTHTWRSQPKFDTVQIVWER